MAANSLNIRKASIRYAASKSALKDSRCIAEVFEGIVCSEHADLAVPKRPAFVEVDRDPAAISID